MNRDRNIIKTKQAILEMANCDFILDNNDWTNDDWKLWIDMYNRVKEDGYVTQDVNCIGMIAPQLTPKGNTFLLQGGYLGEKREKFLRSITNYAGNIVKESIITLISQGSVNILNKIINILCSNQCSSLFRSLKPR